VFALLLDEFCNQPTPSGLVGRAKSGSGIAMKVLMEPVPILFAILVERLD
jgi:hypothetical protein